MSSVLKMLLLLGLLLPRAGLALSGDTRQPIQVQADSVEVDDKQGISVYRGNVRLTQGSIVLLANVITVYHPGRHLEKAVAEGAPAHYRQLLDQKSPAQKPQELRAEAPKMEYFADKEQLILSGGARVWQAGNEFSGAVIEYDVQKDIVRGHGGKSGGRVEVVIQPQGASKP
jgi:lipopolysaccharide export system protein LptA